VFLEVHVRSLDLECVVQPERQDANGCTTHLRACEGKRAWDLIIYEKFFVVMPFFVTVVAMLHDFVYLHSAEHLRPKMRATPPMGIHLF
jgi:hypothetical protein